MSETQKDIAEKAAAQKAEAGRDGQGQPDAGRTAHEGMNPQPNTGIAPSGALDAEGHKPVVERSRKAR
ncbi:MAG TPA: hypothetical protein PKB04_05250 [Phenylobacterium sp.]|nr:hypothetical protein [Phenylobacterium sp.]HMP62755.1 hypothetical protein [Phenylobacterium sp.]